MGGVGFHVFDQNQDWLTGCMQLLQLLQVLQAQKHLAIVTAVTIANYCGPHNAKQTETSTIA